MMRKRSYRKRNRRVRKRVYKSKRVRRSSIVNIKRTMVEAPFSVSGTWSSTQFNFRLEKLPDYSEFNTVFTQYRINAVKLLFIPYADSIDVNTLIGSTTNFVTAPRMYAFVDRDSQPNIASENAVLQHSKLRIVRDPMKPFSIYCAAPALSLGAATTSTVAYSTLKSKQWLSCDSPSPVHNGVIIGGVIPSSGGAKFLSYNVICTYYLQFKGTQ